MNNIKQYQRIVSFILLLISFILLLFFLFWHLKLGITRYFDVDEFAHLHWAGHFASGKRPYVDFLTFFPPGFLFFLAPLFWFSFGDLFPFYASRVVTFFIFVGMVKVTAIMFWDMRHSVWFAIVAAMLIAFLPLPFDKYLEVRPDNLATLLVMLGMWLQLRYFQRQQRHYLFWTGILYASSVVVLTKTVPQIVLATVFLMVYGISLQKRERGSTLVELFKPYLLGLAIPFGLAGLYLVTLGDIGTVLYSLTKLPFEANQISRQFIMMPDLFFYPNSVFYGIGGYSYGLLANHVVWVIGLGFGIYRLLTPFLQKTRSKLADETSLLRVTGVGGPPRRGPLVGVLGGKRLAGPAAMSFDLNSDDRPKVWEELFITSTFMLHVILYVQFIPLKHTQYLIPIGLFVGWFAADALYSLWQWLSTNKIGLSLYALIFIIGSILLYRSFLITNVPKANWTNVEALEGVKKIFTAIPKTEYILDLDGRTLYYPDPYYACCLPFGQSAPFLTRSLPSLPEALEKIGTKYIFQGELRRVQTMTAEDQAYIWAHYKPLNGDPQLLVRF